MNLDTKQLTFDAFVGMMMKQCNISREEAQKNTIINFSSIFTNSNCNEFNSIENSLFQVLESAEIVLSTKNINVFLGRFQFLKDTAIELQQIVNEPSYIQYVCRAVNKYRSSYHDRKISEEHLLFAISPMSVMSDDIFGMYLYKCFERYCDKMGLDLLSFKTEEAKEQVRNSIVETSKLIIPYITTLELVEYANKIFAMITIRFGIEYHINTKTES